MGEIDEASFIQETQHRPKTSIAEAEGIPLIDLSPLQQRPSEDASIADLLEEIDEACRNWGFFQVTNHGVPSGCRERLEMASRQFFARPLEDKRKVKRDEQNPMGYHESEHTKNVRDWKEVFDFVAQDPTVIPASHDPDDNEVKLLVNQWPEYPPYFREACEEYTQEVVKLAFKLLELICLSLGLPAKRLNGDFEDQTSLTRLNYYPRCPFPELALGVGRHKDSGALTVLAQDDVGGLEVKRKSDGEWILVKPTPNAFIINVGDLFQVWSNDRYESVEHRVTVNRDKERFSIPMFFNPVHQLMVQPLEEMTSDENPARYKASIGENLSAEGTQSNFKKMGIDNIQISQFRI